MAINLNQSGSQKKPAQRCHVNRNMFTPVRQILVKSVKSSINRGQYSVWYFQIQKRIFKLDWRGDLYKCLYNVWYCLQGFEILTFFSQIVDTSFWSFASSSLVSCSIANKKKILKTKDNQSNKVGVMNVNITRNNDTSYQALRTRSHWLDAAETANLNSNFGAKTW